MATAADIVGKALRKIAVASIGQEPDAEDAAVALSALNDLMHGFKSRGADLEHTTLASADTVALSEEYHGALVDLLADRIAPEFSTVHPHRADVLRARQAIMAAYQTTTALTVDPALQRMPSRGWGSTRFP